MMSAKEIANRTIAHLEERGWTMIEVAELDFLRDTQRQVAVLKEVLAVAGVNRAIVELLVRKST